MTRGTLILVCGPSGAGKDTLIAGARERLKNDPRFVFPRRVITRAADAGGEDHIAVDVPTFQKMRSNGAFALSWDAHGFSYGIPASIEDDLAQGRHVIVNVSRSVVREADQRFKKCMFIGVTAEPARRRERLAARGRENVEWIEERTGPVVDEFQFRSEGWGPWGVIIQNDRAIEQSIDQFVMCLDVATHRS